MKINKTEFLKALEAVKPGLSNKDFIEQSTSFVFSNGFILTYNDMISVKYPFELGINGAVKANELYQLLNKCKKEEIDIDCSDNELLIEAGRMKAGIVLEKEINLPLEEIGKIDKFKSLPGDFIQGIKFAFTTCSNDNSTPILTCINVRDDGKIESSDNTQISRFQIDKIPTKTFLLPVQSAREIVKYDIVKISGGEGWIHFLTGENMQISCRTFQDKFPEIDQFLDVKGNQIEFPIEKLQDIMQRASIFSHSIDHDEFITISIENKKMKVNAKGNYGWLQEETNIKYKDKKIEFMINPEFLKQVKTGKCIIGERSIKFIGENWEHLVILVSNE